jgi:hypothetical protein
MEVKTDPLAQDRQDLLDAAQVVEEVRSRPKPSVGRRLTVMLAVAAYCLACWAALFQLGSAALHWAQNAQSAMADTEANGASGRTE